MMLSPGMVSGLRRPLLVWVHERRVPSEARKATRCNPTQELYRWHIGCLPGSSDAEIPIGDGESIRRPKKREGLWPCIDLTLEQAVEVQLMALQQNDVPYYDHGIEVLYRFASFDPFQRCNYFGKPLDLGQFERFRRVMHTPYFSILLHHTEHETLSLLQVSENTWKQRIWVVNKDRNNEEGTFEFTMIQRLGGRYDAYFFTESLKRGDQDLDTFVF